MTSSPTTVLVLGATGKTGHRVVRRLADQGIAVRAASRNPADASPHVTPVVFDWADSSTYAPALTGVDVAYVIPPAFIVDHTVEVAAFIETAKSVGVGRLVLLSARGVDSDENIPLRREEIMLENSGLAWSVLRPSWFAQNFTEGFLAESVFGDGVISVPAGVGTAPFIDADDIADVAVALLLDPSFDGKAYNLSGPEALTWGAAVAQLGEALDRPLTFVDADPQEWEQGMAAAGVPADYTGLLATLFMVVRNGWDAHLSDGVEVVLGRKATSFRSWAETVTG